MKKLIFVLSILFSMNLFAQDVIVKRDGSTIVSKVYEIGDKDVKYKKHTNLNGPTYTIAISEIDVINYENGEKESFDVTTKTNSYKELLAMDYKYNIENKIKKKRRNAWLFGASALIVGGALIYAGADGTGTNTTCVTAGGILVVGGIIYAANNLIVANKLKKEYSQLQTTSLWHKEVELNNKKTLMAGVDLINDQIYKKRSLGLGLRMNF